MKSSEHVGIAGGLVGTSPAMAAVRAKTRCASESASNVLISGERGVGKELVARIIHHAGITRAGPFVAVNCRPSAEGCLERKTRLDDPRAIAASGTNLPSLLAEAEGGTLFLDEVANLDLRNQVLLFTAIERSSVSRGERTKRSPLPRIIASTRCDLITASQSRGFRADLFALLAEIPISIPPLRDRAGDIPPLLDYFIDRLCDEMNMPRPALTAAARDALLRHPWPGNARELKNMVERLLLFADGSSIDASDLPFGRVAAPSAAGNEVHLRTALRNFEREHVTNVLRAAGGNKIEAARRMGIGLSSLYRKMDELGIDAEAIASSSMMAAVSTGDGRHRESEAMP